MTSQPRPKILYQKTLVQVAKNKISRYERTDLMPPNVQPRTD